MSHSNGITSELSARRDSFRPESILRHVMNSLICQYGGLVTPFPEPHTTPLLSLIAKAGELKGLAAHSAVLDRAVASVRRLSGYFYADLVQPYTCLAP